jgi:hypothetical protein
MMDDGSLVPEQSAEVGATVTLDWNEGGGYEIDV